MKNNQDENLNLQPNKKELKNFGLIWSAIFFVVAILPLMSGNDFRLWALIVSFVFSSISFSFPEIYEKTKFYSAWIKFGEIIGKINSKIIIAFLFYFIFVPIGLLLKLFKKDLLSKKMDKSSESYFVERSAEESDMKNQF